VLETLTHLRDVVVHVQGLGFRRLLSERAPLFPDFDEESYRRASLARGKSAVASGSWAGPRPSLGDYVTGMGPRTGRSPPEGVNVF
jgi:hypothetical protein